MQNGCFTRGDTPTENAPKMTESDVEFVVLSDDLCDKIVDLPTISRLFSMPEVEALAKLPCLTTVNEVHPPGASFFRRKFTHHFNIFDAHARLQEPNSTDGMFSCWGALTAAAEGMRLAEVPIFTHTIFLNADTYALYTANPQ